MGTPISVVHSVVHSEPDGSAIIMISWLELAAPVGLLGSLHWIPDGAEVLVEIYRRDISRRSERKGEKRGGVKFFCVGMEF